MPQTEARIVDLENGEHFLGNGETGELVIRGPQVMKGYWRDPLTTDDALKGGWLHTGDIATIDADGYCRILDRKKDVIIGTGGNKVYPREVEDVLYEYPKVKVCAVVGVPVKDKGERVKAFIVLKDDTAACPEEIVEFCSQNLAPYKVPHFIEFSEELPTSSAGKVLKRELLKGEGAGGRV
jgi:long-chain acyl-CoA synthetase